MEDFVRKSFLAGIGFLSLTEEKFRKNMEDFVKKGEITEEEGKELVGKFKGRYKDFIDDLEKKINIQIEKIVEKSGLVTKNDLEKIEKRLQDIEDKVNNKFREI
jgi:polyhydroxyalkanoate synthesis regulator phasin